jgi:3-isopropylmalate/(R)-2-methylmalate dehydratase small subunit
MKENTIKEIKGSGIYVEGNDIDTDRIIPARFMKCVTFDGLGEYLFYDVRNDTDGNKKEHPLNDPRFEGASILISDNNFGCGSSREHAPQSIQKAGYSAVIAGSFAEIFFGNSTNLGIVCASVEDIERKQIIAELEKDPSLPITIDVENKRIKAGSIEVSFTIKEGARESLLSGSYDTLNELLEGEDQISSVVSKLAYMDMG